MKFTLLIPWTIFQLILCSEEEDKSVIYRYYSSSDNREHNFLNFEPDFIRDESFGGLGMRGSAFYMCDLRLAMIEGLLSSEASFLAVVLCTHSLVVTLSCMDSASCCLT